MTAITLRNIPAEVQKVIRAKARQKRISINRAVIELLLERVGAVEGRKKVVHRDLDDLAGLWTAAEARSFEKALESARAVDKVLWR